MIVRMGGAVPVTPAYDQAETCLVMQALSRTPLRTQIGALSETIALGRDSSDK